MKLRISTLLGSLLFSASMLNAQLLFNNGADVAVTTGGVLFVDGAVENANGLLSNAGQATVRGYFRNGSTATGGGATGEYIVLGDWENNNTFTADQSIVRLAGNNQLITGTQPTTFYDLTLETANAVKTQTINAYVDHLLALNDCELATADHVMTVSNPVTASVTRGSGFVSSTGTGRLMRYANSTSTYLFPTGWNDGGTIYYRPVELRPSVTDLQAFTVRMAYGDPSLEGYDVNTKAGNVITVNNRYFHFINQESSTAPADLSIYYDAVADGTWGSIGRWQGLPHWEDLLFTTATAGSPLSSITKTGWVENGNEPHALINAKEIEAYFNFPNVFAPGGSIPDNQTFHIINNLGLAEVQSLTIFNRWGEPVFDSARDGKTVWDGSYQGKLQPMGNYVYMASVKIPGTGEIKKAEGNLSLLW
jgi:gliding motility-associated-like protein